MWGYGVEDYNICNYMAGELVRGRPFVVAGRGIYLAQKE